MAEGDLRAWDAEIRGPGWKVHVEAETRITMGRRSSASWRSKLRDGGPGRLILLVGDSRANRHALAALQPALRNLLPLDARPILPALRDGREPPGSGVVVL